MAFAKELKEEELQKVTGGSVEPDMNYTCSWCNKKFYYTFGGEDAVLAGWAYHYHIHCLHDPSPFIDDWGLTDEQKALAKQIYDPEN